ncbi:hypothetical protein IH992_24330 [Candidatus Poribacteria bacterium]|nr:hypothetical protein [Candidatus Poribacteria bacterium]
MRIDEIASSSTISVKPSVQASSRSPGCLDELETEHRAIHDALARIIGEGTTVDAGVNR